MSYAQEQGLHQLCQEYQADMSQMHITLEAIQHTLALLIQGHQSGPKEAATARLLPPPGLFGPLFPRQPPWFPGYHHSAPTLQLPSGDQRSASGSSLNCGREGAVLGTHSPGIAIGLPGGQGRLCLCSITTSSQCPLQHVWTIPAKLQARPDHV